MMKTASELKELKARLRSLVVNDIGATLKALKEELPEGSPRLVDVTSLEGQLNDVSR